MGQSNPNQQILERRVVAWTAYEQLKEAIDALTTAIQRDNHRPAMAYHLPYQGTGDDGEPTGMPAWDEAPLQGEEARRHASTEIARTTCYYHQHPRTVIRAPGVIAASNETLAAAAELNTAKQAFQQAAKAISPRTKTRARILREMVPRISLKQISRQLVALEAKPERIHFTWMTQDSSVRALSVRTLDRELGQRLVQGAPEHIDPDAWQAMIEHARQCLAELPESERIAIRRPVAPFVRAHIYRNGRRQPVSAPLPIVYPDDGDGLVETHPLAAYDPESERTERGDRQIEDEPFIDPLNVYRYRREHRERVAVATST
jgi:hypothetical protein